MIAGVSPCAAASCRGVNPYLFRAFTLAPACASAVMNAGVSPCAAASCRGVRPSSSRAFTLAPACSSAVMNAGVSPCAAARCRGVDPYLSRAFTLAPACTSAVMNAGVSLCSAASCRSVDPSLSRVFTLAPACASAVMISGVLLKYTAWRRGVHPPSSRAFTLAPACASAVMNAGVSLCTAAKCRGVDPFSSRAFGFLVSKQRETSSTVTRSKNSHVFQPSQETSAPNAGVALVHATSHRQTPKKNNLTGSIILSLHLAATRRDERLPKKVWIIQESGGAATLLYPLRHQSFGITDAEFSRALDIINEKRYVSPVIKSFKDRETEKVFRGRFSRRLPRDVQRIAARKLEQLNAATVLDTLRIPPGNRLEALTRERRGQYSIRVNDQWRVCFAWRGGDAFDVEIVDYH